MHSCDEVVTPPCDLCLYKQRQEGHHRSCCCLPVAILTALFTNSFRKWRSFFVFQLFMFAVHVNMGVPMKIRIIVGLAAFAFRPKMAWRIAMRIRAIHATRFAEKPKKTIFTTFERFARVASKLRFAIFGHPGTRFAKGVHLGNPQVIRANQAIRANLRIDSRESGHNI